jgi:ubiquinone/menaquinone biosynthesis C-methylase UbiE
MPSMFNARDAANYERLMGRWSRRLAPVFIAHAGIAEGDDIVEVGCGTGSLTFALPEAANIKSLDAIDHSQIYLAAAQAKNRDPRIHIEHGDGSALRFADASFDRALSMLVLPSVLPRPEQAVAEMRRVTRPAGSSAPRSGIRRAVPPPAACSGTPPPPSTRPPPRRATARWAARFTRRAPCRGSGPRLG